MNFEKELKMRNTNIHACSIQSNIPYATLSVMTVPAIFSVTSNPLAGIAALILAGLTAWFSSNLFLSAAVASIAVLIVQMLV